MRGRRRLVVAFCYLTLAATTVIAANSTNDLHSQGRSLNARVNFQQEVDTNGKQQTSDDDKDYTLLVETDLDDGDGDEEDEARGMQQDILKLESDLAKQSLQDDEDEDWEEEDANTDAGWSLSKRVNSIDEKNSGSSVHSKNAGATTTSNNDKIVEEPGPKSPVSSPEVKKNTQDSAQQANAAAAAARVAAARAKATTVGKGNQKESTIPSSPPPSPNPFNLPSFDATPLPPKRSFAQWQAAYQDARRASTREHFARVRGILPGKLHASQSSPNSYEFTSRISLDPEAPHSSYAAACLVVRDAHDDLAEWVHYHLKLNFSKIYIYDHASMPPLLNVVKRWVDSGSVVYERFDDDFYHPSGRPQLYGYDKCLRDHSKEHHWLAFFDVDEFLIFQNGPPVQDLPTLLRQYESYSGLAVHWILFGSSGREYRPAQGTLRSYTKCLPLNHTHHLYVKTLANTKCTVRSSDNPHVFYHNCSRPAVRTNFSPVHAKTAEGLPVHDVIALQHYAIRSAEEFEIKMARGSGMKRQRGWDYFYFVDNWSVEYCLAGLQVWDDDVITLSRTIDPGSLQLQIDKYATEEHEDFWGAKAKAAAEAAKAAEAAAKVAAAATAKIAQAQEQAQGDLWGKDLGDESELDEHGGEIDDDVDDYFNSQQQRKR